MNKKNDFAKAEKLFVDVMQRQLSYKGVSKDDNSIIAMSLKLAIIFSKTDQHEKAQQGFEFCIDTQETKIKAGKYIKKVVFLMLKSSHPLFKSPVLKLKL